MEVLKGGGIFCLYFSTDYIRIYVQTLLVSGATAPEFDKLSLYTTVPLQASNDPMPKNSTCRTTTKALNANDLRQNKRRRLSRNSRLNASATALLDYKACLWNAESILNRTKPTICNGTIPATLYWWSADKEVLDKLLTLTSSSSLSEFEFHFPLKLFEPSLRISRSVSSTPNTTNNSTSTSDVGHKGYPALAILGLAFFALTLSVVTFRGVSVMAACIWVSFLRAHKRWRERNAALSYKVCPECGQIEMTSETDSV